MTGPGTSVWTFRWTAPDVNVGPITFYVASVAANNDELQSDDFVYMSSASFTPLTSDIENIYADKNAIRVFPNPVEDYLFVTCQDPASTSIVLFDLSGKVVLRQQLSSKLNKVKLPEMGPGIYLYQISRDRVTLTQGKLLTL